MAKFTNALIHETSPYLLQHAHNPVNWQAWSDDALESAQNENKLIIVSVGYAACHWCHVMEHESFEDEEVATLMNEKYVSIKVDREERPDIDQVYMDAAQLLTGRGGWPLNVIALPDGRPIYAGTYFTRDQWMKVLKGVNDFYNTTPEKALEQAMQVAAGVNKMNFLPNYKSSKFNIEIIKQAAADWLNAMDNREGGRSGQMKFPMPSSYLALLRYGVAFNDQRAIDLVRLTLDKMASGGLYDQLGGGFSRYSVDPYWHVPHFEKMLYDNAQLITLYSEAFKYFKDPFYRQIVEETIEFCELEMKANTGGYISSIDADSEGEEGMFYIWTEDELDKVLGSDSKLFKAFYGVTPEGNWEEGKNVLKMSRQLNDLVNEFGLSVDEIGSKIKDARTKLVNVRKKRIRPADDDKILTSWNALMIVGFTHAFEAIGDERYKKRALELAEFIKTNLQEDGHLRRTFKDGRSSINGFLDDYTFLVSAFIRLYSVTFDKKWIIEAEELMKCILNDFRSDSGLFNFKSSGDRQLYVKKQVLEDNVIPSGNSETAKNLFYLGSLLGRNEYLDSASKMVQNLEPRIKEHAAFYSNWFDLYAINAAKYLEIAIAGDEYEEKRLKTSSMFIPYSMILGGNSEDFTILQGKLKKNITLIYVCVEKSCQRPLESLEEDDLIPIYSV